jgi:hypothetical protein
LCIVMVMGDSSVIVILILFDSSLISGSAL